MQTEKKGLAKREKVLLFIMIVVVLFAVMVMYVIIPLYNHLEDLRAEHNSLQMEKSRIDTLLLSENNIREGRNQAIEQHKADSARFLDESHASEIGRMLTVLCEKHNLLPVDQRLEDPKDFVIDKDNADAETVFLIMSASMTLNGNYRDLMRLMDTVEEIDYLRISRMSYVWSIDQDITTMDRISVGFEVTMIKDVDFSKIEAELQEEQDDDNWHGLDLG